MILSYSENTESLKEFIRKNNPERPWLVINTSISERFNNCLHKKIDVPLILGERQIILI